MRGARCRIKPIGICSSARSDSHDRASRHLRARQLAAARAMAGFPVRAAGVEISRADELRGRIARPLGRRETRQPAVPDLAGGKLDLRATGRAREPYRQRAHARARHGPRSSRAAARAEQPDDGGGLSRRNQSRRRRGRDHAALTRQGDRLSDCQGQNPPRAVRSPPGRGDGESPRAGGRSRARRLLGRRRGRCTRSADGNAGLRDLRPCDTASDDVCLIGFTSGTTGEPKGTMHFHRDMLATCDSYGRHVLRADAQDRFIGSPPLAFTFGLGGLVLFPLRVGAASILIEKASPDDLLAAIAKFGATVAFTAPTAYRAMLAKLAAHDVSSLRKCVSAGEALPKATFDAWLAATGIKILDGIGATEMLHIFIGSPEHEIRPGATGKPVPGYEARVLDAEGKELPPNTIGRLAVRGPTGCRYLADKRQRHYVQDGWNITGDTYLMDADGYFWYQARSDDMIVSSGYNIAGPEVEAALLEHPAVAECGVVAAPDEERGQIVKAYVVLRPGYSGDAAATKMLQDHVKATIAPYKYPRTIAYVTQLPRTQTGKLQRFELRRMAADAASHKLAS